MKNEHCILFTSILHVYNFYYKKFVNVFKSDHNLNFKIFMYQHIHIISHSHTYPDPYLDFIGKNIF